MTAGPPTLAISTAHRACSAAILADGGVIAAAHEEIGVGHAERLAPLVAELLGAAGLRRAERIIVDIGPGSFTGIRVGMAMAHGLALAWGCPLGGCTGDRLVAVRAFAAWPDADALLVLLDGRRGEVFARSHGREGARGEAEVLTLEEAARRARSAPHVAGNGLVAAGLQGDAAWDPRAADAGALTPPERMLDPQPLYLRPSDARLPA